jgi:hypothetical protein
VTVIKTAAEKAFSEHEKNEDAGPPPFLHADLYFPPEKQRPAPFRPGVIPFVTGTSAGERKPVTSGAEDKGNDAPIRGGALRMLKVLVSRYPIKLTKSQLATLSKLSPRSGTYGTYFSALKSNGFIELDGDHVMASKTGLDFIGEAPVPLQSSEEVIDMWRNNLKGGARRMFDALVAYYPHAMTKQELGNATELEPTSGTFGTYLSMLRSNGLIETRGHEVKASGDLFV